MNRDVLASTTVGARAHGPLADVFAPALVLLAPFANFVRHNQYDLWSVEIGLVAGSILLAGAVIGTLVALLHEPWRAFVLAVVIAMSIDLQIEGLTLSGFLYLPALAYVFTRLLSRHATRILTVMALAAIGSNLFLPDRLDTYAREVNEVAGVPPDSLPPVIHLVLDEYAGPDGLPPEMESLAALRSEIVSLFVDEGFHLYGGAYSQYFDTYNALGNALNFAAMGQDAFHFEESAEPYRLLESRYFEMLSERGYRFRMYQSTFMDFCRIPEIVPATCTTYSVNSIKYVEDLPLPRSQKASFIYHSFMEISVARSSARIIYNAVRRRPPFESALPFWKSRIVRVGPIPVLPLFEEITGDILRDSGGTVYFAHLLAPHSPYLLDADCSVRADLGEWRSRRILAYSWSEPNNAESRALAYQTYAEQLRCTNRLVAGFLDKLRTAGTLDDAIVIIHGDHGSRINRNWPTVPNRMVLRESDFVDGFPTLFAARAPGISLGYTRDRLTLTAVLAKTFGVPERAPTETGVFLYDGDGEALGRDRMPDDWMAPPP